ncbi:MAG: radical SAM protein [candidate division WOR-3 bacterium]|nr:radical SAM protein [candidate division WOR-3 bacterium]
MAQCQLCQKNSPVISQYLSFCVDCIRTHFLKIKDKIDLIHQRSRIKFNLPLRPSRTKGGLKCGQCINQCILGEAETGYCNIYKNISGNLVGASKDFTYLQWYYDPLPTNCVAEGFCSANISDSAPYAYLPNSTYGYKNLAVFFCSCNFNCLFCQNWHYREKPTRMISFQELVDAVDNKTFCLCFFGGDPGPNLPFAIKVSEQILTQIPRPLPICWETNGAMTETLLNRIIDLSLNSGGCIKFDLKAYNEALNYALCGVSNKQTLKNIKKVAKYIYRRPKPPLLIISTLLIPGYIDQIEISQIAQFIANIDKNIPWILLAFYPCFYFSDMPITTKSQAEQALKIAQSCGLKNVRLGNIHLLV